MAAITTTTATDDSPAGRSDLQSEFRQSLLLLAMFLLPLLAVALMAS